MNNLNYLVIAFKAKERIKSGRTTVSLLLRAGSSSCMEEKKHLAKLLVVVFRQSHNKHKSMLLKHQLYYYNIVDVIVKYTQHVSTEMAIIWCKIKNLKSK
jgi:hypothetical protein